MKKLTASISENIVRGISRARCLVMMQRMKLVIVSLVLVAVSLVPRAVLRAGAIDEAQPLSVGLANILDFLLSIIGIVAIIALVIAGGLYFFSAGDMRQLALAKRMTLAGITGIVVALGGYLLIRTLAGLLAT